MAVAKDIQQAKIGLGHLLIRPDVLKWYGEGHLEGDIQSVLWASKTTAAHCSSCSVTEVHCGQFQGMQACQCGGDSVSMAVAVYQHQTAMHM